MLTESRIDHFPIYDDGFSITRFDHWIELLQISFGDMFFSASKVTRFKDVW